MILHALIMIIKSKIYVAGGKSSLAGARGLSSAEVYKPRFNMGTSLPNMNTLRYKCVEVTWQGKILCDWRICGGR